MSQLHWHSQPGQEGPAHSAACVLVSQAQLFSVTVILPRMTAAARDSPMESAQKSSCALPVQANAVKAMNALTAGQLGRLLMKAGYFLPGKPTKPDREARRKAVAVGITQVKPKAEGAGNVRYYGMQKQLAPKAMAQLWLNTTPVSSQLWALLSVCPSIYLSNHLSSGYLYHSVSQHNFNVFLALDCLFAENQHCAKCSTRYPGYVALA